MAATNPAATISTAAGIAKRVHGKLQDLIPSRNMKFTRRFKLDKENLVGSEYYEPVFLTGEHGATFTGNSGAAATLNGAEVAESQPASLNPSGIWFQTRVVQDSLHRMSQKGDKAFENYVTAMMRNTRKGLDKRVEIVHNYGTYSLATLTSATDANTSSVFTITTATWAPHVWLGMRNCHIDAYNSTSLVNTRADLVITKVDIANKQITVSGNASDIDDIMAVGANGSGITLYLKGMYGNTGPGVRNYCKLASGTTLLGILSTTYNDVWAATQKTWDVTTTPFTFTLLNEGVEEAVGRGLQRNLIAQVPFKVWSTLNSSLDALRMFDSSYSVSKVEMGHAEDAITYNCHGVKVTIEPSGFVPYGEVWCYPEMNEDDDAVKIIGSTPITFDTTEGKEMVYIVPGTNQVEWMAYTCQSVFSTCPRDFIYFGG